MNEAIKTKEKVIEVVHKKIQNYRETVSAVLGYDISSGDGLTFKFLSTFANERSDIIKFSRQEDGSLEMHPAPLFERADMSDLIESTTSIPILMAKTTLELS